MFVIIMLETCVAHFDLQFSFIHNEVGEYGERESHENGNRLIFSSFRSVEIIPLNILVYDCE